MGHHEIPILTSKGLFQVGGETPRQAERRAAKKESWTNAEDCTCIMHRKSLLDMQTGRQQNNSKNNTRLTVMAVFRVYVKITARMPPCVQALSCSLSKVRCNGAVLTTEIRTNRLYNQNQRRIMNATPHHYVHQCYPRRHHYPRLHQTMTATAAPLASQT